MNPLRRTMIACRWCLVVAMLGMATSSAHDVWADGAKPKKRSNAEATAETRRWTKLVGVAPFVEGYEAGILEARFSGRPMLVFVALHSDARTDMLSEWILRKPTVQQRLSHFVIVTIDADAEPEVAKRFDRYRMETRHPYLRFVSATEEAVGMQIGFVGDAVPFPPQMPKFFLDHSKKALGEIRPRLTKAYRKLMKADAELTKAMKHDRYRKALKAVAVIEKIQHPGAVMRRAEVAKATLRTLSETELQQSKALLDSDRDAALQRLKKLAADFKGLAAADQARATLRKLKK